MHTVGQVRDEREEDQTGVDRGRPVDRHALCARPLPVRAAALDPGQVHLPGTGDPEDRERRQHERESQQFDENNVRSIIGAAALMVILPAQCTCVCFFFFYLSPSFPFPLSFFFFFF